MKTLFCVLLIALLAACDDGQYRCVNGSVYRQLNPDTLVISGVYAGMPCVEEKK